MSVTPLEREYEELIKDFSPDAKLFARVMFLVIFSQEVLKRYEELSRSGKDKV